MALLRDACVSIGLALSFSSGGNDATELILENNPEELRKHLSAYLTKTNRN